MVVGDSPWDMLAAGRRRALGVGILAGGYSKRELEESGAFRVYADPAEMLLHVRASTLHYRNRPSIIHLASA